MKNIRYTVLLVLTILLAASIAQAYTTVPTSPGHVVVVEDGAPANWQNLRWADDVLHTNPVRDNGIAPRYIHQGFSLNPLGDRDASGNIVDYYVTWTSGASGEIVWIKVHPGESTEMRPTEATSCYTLNGEEVVVRMWIGGWFTRCANGTRVVNWQPEAKIQIKTVPGPEQLVEVPKPYPVPQPYPVYQYIFAPLPRTIEVPQAQTIIYYQSPMWHDLLGLGAAYAGRTRVSITATGGTANSSAAAASSSEADATNNTDVDVDNVNINENQLQQQQQ